MIFFIALNCHLIANQKVTLECTNSNLALKFPVCSSAKWLQSSKDAASRANIDMFCLESIASALATSAQTAGLFRALTESTCLTCAS